MAISLCGVEPQGAVAYCCSPTHVASVVQKLQQLAKEAEAGAQRQAETTAEAKRAQEKHEQVARYFD